MKIFFLIAALFLLACKSEDVQKDSQLRSSDIKIGIILITDESDNGYSYNHMIGLRKAAKELFIPYDNVIVKRNVSEAEEETLKAFRELAQEGVNIIFATSFGYEEHMLKIAKEYPEIEFSHSSGFRAASSGLKNVHNYFPKIFEARYLSGIAAGLKAKEINNPKLGYVGAFDFAEVISGFTAFYLGAKRVYPEVQMEVIYIMSWNSEELEKKATRELIAGGAGVIGQHSDSYAPAVVAEQHGVFQVGYNSDVVAYAPQASIISARARWEIYYKYAISAIKKKEKFSVDWNGGYADSAIYLTPLNKGIAAQGTNAEIKAAEKDLKEGFKIFSGPIQGRSANGNVLDLKKNEFYDENAKTSAPSFDYLISGITARRL